MVTKMPNFIWMLPIRYSALDLPIYPLLEPYVIQNKAKYHSGFWKLDMESVRAIRLFVLAVQNKSLSSAGRVMGLSPPSVTRHVSALEDELGTQLLNRSSRRVSLTQAGELFYERAI